MFIIFKSLEEKLKFLEFRIVCRKAVKIVNGESDLDQDEEQQIMKEYLFYKVPQRK
jgi:hypothetical protein